jgi:hypothetical protein
MVPSPRRHLSMLRSYTPADPLTIVLYNRVGDSVWFGAYRIGPAVLHPPVLMYVLSGSAMISATLRIPKP